MCSPNGHYDPKYPYSYRILAFQSYFPTKTCALNALFKVRNFRKKNILCAGTKKIDILTLFAVSNPK